MVCLIAVAMLLLLNACHTQKPHFRQEISVLDYAAASLDGKILLTESPSVSFDYISLASVVVSETSGYEVLETTVETKVEKDFGDTLYAASAPREKKIERNTYGEFKEASPQSALLAAANAANNMGGDAIIGLKVQPILSGFTTIGYSVSGMVVKRR